MDLVRAARLDHGDHPFACRPAHYRVVDDDDVLPLEHLGDGIQFNPHTKMPHPACRFDEGPSHVPVADNALLVGYAALFRVAERSDRSAVGHSGD